MHHAVLNDTIIGTNTPGILEIRCSNGPCAPVVCTCGLPPTDPCICVHLCYLTHYIGNNRDFNLPMAGGFGARAFHIAGMAVVVATAVLMVVLYSNKKRNSAA